MSTMACHRPKEGIESKVLRLCWRFRRKRAKAKENLSFDTKKYILKLNIFTIFYFDFSPDGDEAELLDGRGEEVVHHLKTFKKRVCLFFKKYMGK